MRRLKEGLINGPAFPQRLKPRCYCYTYGGTEVPPLQSQNLFRASLKLFGTSVGKGKRKERNGRNVFATEPVTYPLRPLRSPRFLSSYSSDSSRMTDRQNVSFLFLLRQPGNNLSNFIEYLLPALELTALSRALHGFISSVGEFRLAVSEVLKDGHVERTVDGLMFYS